MKKQRKRQSTQISDSPLTSFVTLYDEVAELEEVSISMRDISGDKKVEVVYEKLAKSLADKVSKTFPAHTAYTGKFSAQPNQHT